LSDKKSGLRFFLNGNSQKKTMEWPLCFVLLLVPVCFGSSGSWEAVGSGLASATQMNSITIDPATGDLYAGGDITALDHVVKVFLLFFFFLKSPIIL
jgi:hypothetical protein